LIEHQPLSKIDRSFDRSVPNVLTNQIRAVQAAEAEAHLPSPCSTRYNGMASRLRASARTPIDVRTELERAPTEIEEFRKTMPPIPLEELLSARDGGHKN
jgi:hypothetical protein